jgi:EmrB/QacA subfamily drug resistance transporter
VTAQSADAEVSEGINHRALLIAMSGLIIGGFVGQMSATIVATALPTVMGDLNGSVRDYSWVVTAYLIAMTVTVPIFGKLADVYNKKKLYLIGMCIYLLGSAMAGLSQSPDMLIAARGFQGLGTGGMAALGGTIVAAMVSARQRGKYSSYNGIAMIIGTISGPLLGGFLVTVPVVGWRACFYVALPFGLLSMFLIHRKVVVPPSTGARKLDIVGVVLLLGWVVPLLLWLSLGGDAVEWVSGLGLVLLIASIVVCVAFFVWEVRAADPMVPLDMFRLRPVALVVAGSLVAGAVSLAAPIYIAQYLQLGHGFSALRSGLATIPFIVGSFCGIYIGGQLMTRLGVIKPFLVTGGAAQTLGALLLALLAAHAQYVTFAWILFIFGIGVGILQQHTIIAVQNAIPHTVLGRGTAAMWFARFLGGAAGVAGLGALMSHFVVQEVVSGAASIGITIDPTTAGQVPIMSSLPEGLRLVFEEAYRQAFAQVFVIVAPLTLITLICMLFMPGARLPD